MCQKISVFVILIKGNIGLDFDLKHNFFIIYFFYRQVELRHSFAVYLFMLINNSVR